MAWKLASDIQITLTDRICQEVPSFSASDEASRVRLIADEDDVFERRVIELVLKSERRVGTGGRFWAASLHLARWIFANRGLMANRHVLELACGLGLPSLVAARCGAKEVLATDFIPAVLDMLRANACGNGLQQVRASPLDFTAAGGLISAGVGRWDIVLFADCVYHDGAGESLIRSVKALLSPSCGVGVGVLPGPGVRSGLDVFWHAVESDSCLLAEVRSVDSIEDAAWDADHLNMRLVILRLVCTPLEIRLGGEEVDEQFDTKEWDELGDLFSESDTER